MSLFCFNLLGESTYLRGEHRNLGYKLLIGRWLSLQRTRHFAHKQTKLSGRRKRTTPETTCKLSLINEGQHLTDRPKSIVHNYLLLFSLVCSPSNILYVYTSALCKSNGSNLTSNQHNPYFQVRHSSTQVPHGCSTCSTALIASPIVSSTSTHHTKPYILNISHTYTRNLPKYLVRLNPYTTSLPTGLLHLLPLLTLRFTY